MSGTARPWYEWPAHGWRMAVLSLALAVVVAGAAHGESFLKALEDVPLMPGLTEVEDQGVAFEAPTGRIVETAAAGERKPGMSPGDVLGFYASTLPALGWNATGEARYVRSGEELTIEATEEAGRVLVRSSLAPE